LQLKVRPCGNQRKEGKGEKVFYVLHTSCGEGVKKNGLQKFESLKDVSEAAVQPGT